MFQLIVAVISIALVAALAIASIYYGGAAFTKSSLRANVTTLVNAGQQISGAVALYKTDYSKVPTMSQLLTDAEEYLSAEPGHAPFTTGSWAISGKVAQIAITGDTAQVCTEAARQAGSTAGQFGCNTAKTYFEFKL